MLLLLLVFVLFLFLFACFSFVRVYESKVCEDSGFLGNWGGPGRCNVGHKALFDGNSLRLSNTDKHVFGICLGCVSVRLHGRCLIMQVYSPKISLCSFRFLLMRLYKKKQLETINMLCTISNFK